MMLTKGQEYLIAIVAMALFPVFWWLMNRKRRQR
jgi:hypothetical protein